MVWQTATSIDKTERQVLSFLLTAANSCFGLLSCPRSGTTGVSEAPAYELQHHCVEYLSPVVLSAFSLVSVTNFSSSPCPVACNKHQPALYRATSLRQSSARLSPMPLARRKKVVLHGFPTLLLLKRTRAVDGKDSLTVCVISAEPRT